MSSLLPHSITVATNRHHADFGRAPKEGELLDARLLTNRLTAGAARRTERAGSHNWINLEE
jgi:hypothetical protein